jgi:hypothetical protein
VKITIAKYYLPSGKGLLREKVTENGKIRWIGGVEPDIWIGPDEPDGWRNEEITRLEEKRAFDEYLEKNFDANRELFTRLAAYDGGKPDDYPGFDEFYTGLSTRLDRESAWWWLRYKTRRKVGDVAGRELVGDFVTDQQLQRAVLAALSKLGIDPSTVDEYKLFANREFPEVDPGVRGDGAAGADPETR